MNYTEMLNYVKENVDFKERLAQLAEEATELAKAALKYRRTLDDENPTPVSKDEAFKNLVEEIDDVALCLDTLSFKWRVEFNIFRGFNAVFQSSHEPFVEYACLQREQKLNRWVKRIKKKSQKGDVDNAGR